MTIDDSKLPDASPESHHSGESLLESIGRRTGRVPHTLLEDSGSKDDSPIVDPRVESYQDQLTGQDKGKYRVVGEIASGGMGVVLRGHDKELGRDVAMKVVHERLADRPEVIDRFIEEAQIGGQLQHPGIVPVYEIGLLGDQRPYFTMKLVKGHTLAKMLSRRKSSDEDRVRFLNLFESICQTMAYAHSKGVIHRDLKPANVMVGSFGEVQVVDWGLSKVMKRGGVADEVAAQDTAMSVIETVRSGPGSTGSDSIIGNVLGTPAYMAPEQARGEIASLDERADVFALGAILCEILTGAPPYTGAEGKDLVKLASLAELDPARERIEASNAHAELKKLCLACLMPSRRARPDSAQEVAEAIHEHLSGLESAAHEAQLAAAEERLRAARSGRKLQFTLLVGALLLLAGGGWWWTGYRDDQRQLEVAGAFEEARDSALTYEREGEFTLALDAARSGLRLVEAAGAGGALRAEAVALVEHTEDSLVKEDERLATEERDQKLLAFLEDIAVRQAGTGLVDTLEEVEAENREAFRDYGIDLEDPDLIERVEELRDKEISVLIARGIDGWAQVLRRMGMVYDDEVELLNSIALDLDPNPIRSDVRLAVLDRDRAALVELAREIDVESAEPETLVLLSSALYEQGEGELSTRIMTDGADSYPGHFLLNYWAGWLLSGLTMDRPRYLRSEGYLRAALAARPGVVDVYNDLGDFYRSVGDRVLASRWAERAYTLAPQNGWNGEVLAFDFLVAGDYERAVEWYEREERESGFLDRRSQGQLRYCRVMTGRATPEEYAAWVEGVAQTDDDSIYTRVTLAFVYITPRAGYELEPERTLDALQPLFDNDRGVGPAAWQAIARARILVGDGPGAVEACKEFTLDLSSRNLETRAVAELLGAAAHRMVGDDAGAGPRLERAQRILRDLTAGNEEAWSNSLLVKSFDLYAAIAEGR